MILVDEFEVFRRHPELLDFSAAVRCDARRANVICSLSEGRVSYPDS